MYHCGMRQMEERHVANQVDLMVWSNRLDLLAISNFKGEVQVHRLHWQKVWNLPPPKENVTVSCMAWRPDGKALAVGYSSGSVYIIDIEDKDVLDKYDLEHEISEDFEGPKNIGITCITWAVRAGTLESATEYSLYEDTTMFLQKPSSFTAFNTSYKNQGGEDSVKSLKEIQEPKHLTMLLVGYGSGCIFMSIFGRYPYGTVQLAQVTRDEGGDYKILDISLSDDFSVMQVVYIDRVTKNVLLSLVNTSVLSAYAEEIFVVANKHGQITQMLSYLDQTMTSITEAWEHILLEMDTKMAYYAASVPEGGVSADLLELLMLGVPSDELELFLLQELTAKGLKKFGNSVELSYSTIQKLVLRQLNIVGQHLTYYLSELRGLTRIPDRYKTLGVEESTVTGAIRACCSFLNKCLELQQVIDASMRNYKAFFRWLFVVIVRLLDEQTPSDIVKINQQELSHIAEFLYNFDNVQVESNDSVPEKPVKFNLERLGQYLQDQDLSILPDDEDNPWHKFLRDNSCIMKDTDTIFCMAEFKKYSLVQQHKYLKNAVYQIFDVTHKDVGKNFSLLYNIKCYENKSETTIENNIRVSQLFDAAQQRFMMAFLNLNDKHEVCFMSTNLKERTCSATASKYHFLPNLLKESKDKSTSGENVAVLDIQFYSSDYLSVLIEHPHNVESSIFVQVPLKIAVENSCDFNIKSKSYIFSDKMQNKNMSSLLEYDVYKFLDKMDGFRIAVSGGRKVAVVLSKSFRKVRVFEMEVDGDEDEDETLDITPQSHNRSSNSHCMSEQQNITTDETFE
ncbi:anaphase-promoting complex subunit 4 [Ostrinia furnacalis]|uniref:anaphase-promoting complex subunit 4 n=1 Tax=Ostrinia furnacalis TaxID=93504 RepID=UPI00103B6CC9|nr:anaphase-promoting complex subunit 4 [Ostrinia furnacalis]